MQSNESTGQRVSLPHSLHCPIALVTDMSGRVLTSIAMIPGRWLISAGVFALALMLLFYRLGDGSLYNWDEAIYAQVAKEMLLSHTLGTPHWHGDPFFHKPPLYFWLTVLTYKTIGVSEFAARLWPAIFGFGVVVLTFILGTRFRSWAVGAGAALLLLVVDHSYYSQWWNFLSLSRVAMLDTPLTFWIVAALALLWEAERRPWLITVMGLAVGLAVMTKAWPGFFAAVIPLIYRVLTGKGRPEQARYWIIAGGLAGVIILPWHLWQYGVYGQAFLTEYFNINLAGRVFQPLEEHSGDLLFYARHVREGFSLWGYLWPLAVMWVAWKAYNQRDRRACLLLCWMTVPLLLFSIAQTKLGWYIGMIYPAVALLVGITLAEVLTDRVALGIVAVVMVACCIRLPTPADGSPDVKQFGPHVAQHALPGDTVYVFEPVCSTRTPSLSAAAMVFYTNRHLTCIEALDIREGRHVAHAYVILDWKSWARFSHLGRVVFEAGGYILARWN